MNHGKAVEDFVEYLCRRSFFADFTFRSPEYHKQGGQKKEAADVLVVFRGTLLAIQVRSKEVDAPSGEISSVDSARIWRSIEKATRQFRAFGEALNRPSFTSFKNGRGITIEFDKKGITDVVLVIIFAPICKGAPEKEATLTFSETCRPEAAIPLHLFTLKQFSLLLTLLDTLPDFLLYLDGRWMLHRDKLIPPETDPLDEWAFATFEQIKLIEVLEKRSFIEISGLLKQHIKSIKRLEKREKPSYLIDRFIERMSASAGSQVSIDSRFKTHTVLLEEPNSLNAYHLVIPYLAKLNRNQRGRLAEEFLIRIGRCEKQPISFGGLKFEGHEEGYLVLASTWNRHERQVALFNIGRALGFKLKLRKVVCLAASANGPEVSPSDAMLIDLSNMTINDTLIEASETLFGTINLQRMETNQ